MVLRVWNATKSDALILFSLEYYRVMALDFGTKRIGVAVSDPMRMLASARGIIPNDDLAVRTVIQRAQEEGARVVILGLPKTLSNQDSEMTQLARHFGSKLEPRLQDLGIELIYRDERLTSMMANANIAGSSLGKERRKEKALRDEEAARILLQEFLDSTR